MTLDPAGFVGYTANLGLKDSDDDFAVVVSDGPCVSAAMFTQSLFAGPSVIISREAAASRALRGIMVISKNANVATGAAGRAHAEEVRAQVAGRAGISPEELLITSTGVIGRPYPMDMIRENLALTPQPLPAADLDAAARAMMTTDTMPKVARRSVGPATVVGIAKGVGMIEPNMATMLSFFFTDAEIAADELDAVFRRVVERTFNSLSIDTDTSTSDTVVILANGRAGAVDPAEFEEQLYQAALELVRKIATDGEGATKRIEVQVTGAADDRQARRVAKTIVNSPLVKTAVHGADPNWGRVVMAIGKLHDEDIDPARVRVHFGDLPMYPGDPGEEELAVARTYLEGSQVEINVELGNGEAAWRVYGCDLTEGYVHINADYTT